MARDDDFNRWAGATAGFAAGGLYGFRNLGAARSAFGGLVAPVQGPVMSTSQNIAQQIIHKVSAGVGSQLAANNITQAHSLARLGRIQSSMSKYQGIPGVQEAVMREWEAAKAAVLPTGMELGKFKVSSADPLGGIELALRGSSNVYTQSTFRRFAGNVETLFQTGEFGGFHDISRMGWQLGGLEPRPATLSGGLQTTISDLQKLFPLGLETTRVGPEGMGELRFSLRGQKNTLFSIPEAFGPGGGLARTGAGMHNIYAPGQFAYLGGAGEIGEAMSFGEFKAKSLLEAAREAVEQGTPIEKAIKARSEEVGKMMDWIEPFTTDDLSMEAIFKSQRLTVLDSNNKPIKGIEAQNVLTKYGQELYPTGKAGRFSTADPSQVFGGFYESIDPARKPWQWMKNMKPSVEAQEAIRASTYGAEKWDFLDSPTAVKAFGGPSGARLKTLYLNDNQIELLKGMGFYVGDGELLVNESFRNQATVTRTKRVALKEVTDELAARMVVTGRAGSMPTIGPEGLLLGRDELGRLVKGAPGMEIIGADPLPGRSGIKGVNLMMRETIQMGEWEKLFGGLKGMGRFTSFSGLAQSKELQQATGLTAAQLAEFGAIGRIGDIGKAYEGAKDPALKAMQLFSGVVAEAEEMGAPIMNPGAEMARVQLSGDIQGSIEAIAEKQGMTRGSAQWRRIFGDEAVVGVSRLHFGGEKARTGAGKLGTLEPRILTLLEGGKGSFGTTLSEDLVGRVMLGDPERLALGEEMRKTFASMAPGAPIQEAAIDLTEGIDEGLMQRIRREGGYIKTGIPEMPSMYVPGYEGLEKLAPLKLEAGRMTYDSPIQQIVNQMIGTSKERLAGTISAEEAMERFQGKGGYLTQLFQQYAPGGKGQASLARGQVYGSRFLTGVSGKSEFYQRVADLGLQKEQVIGIPRTRGAEMIQELIDYGKASAEEGASMLARFEAGEAIGGAVARHPFIGHYSMQPVKMLAIDELEDVMYAAETPVKATLAGGKEIDLMEGFLTGLAMDKDADIGMAIAVNREMEEKVFGELAKGSARTEQFAHHAARMQLFKAKAVKDPTARPLSREAQRAVAGTKLGIVDEYVGRVSSALTKARVSVMNSNLDQGSQLRALGLLEWLEQQPISAKHLTPQMIEKGIFQEQMETIIAGAAGDANLLENVVHDMLQTADPDVKAGLLGKGLDLAQPVTFNQVSMSRIEGFDLPTTTKQISEAVKSFQTSRVDGVVRSNVQKFMQPGTATSISRNQIPDMLQVTQGMKTAAQGGLKEMQKNALAAINKAAGQVMQRTKPFAKPMMYGLLGAAAAGYMMSGPPGTLEAPEGEGGTPVFEDTGMQAVMGRASRDEVQIPELESPGLGAPTAPGSRQQRAVNLNEERHDRSRDIRMRIAAENMSRQQREELVSRLNSRFPGTVNVNVNDSRRTLNQQTITDMIE